jgi:hypothetical protein
VPIEAANYRKAQHLVKSKTRRKKRQILGLRRASAPMRDLFTIAFSGPPRCCDVTNLYQAFSQHAGPGRLCTSLDAPRLIT